MQPVMFAAVWALAAPTLGQVVHLVEDPAAPPFVDIAGVGELLLLDGDEEVDIGTFGGNFVFRAGLIVVGQNGGMSFGQVTISDLQAINQEIPSVDAFLGGQAALAFWDDIDDKEGDTYFIELVDDPVLGSRLVVQWNFGNFDGAGSTLRFQVHILPNVEPTGTYAQYFYEIDGPAAAAGGSATIGYQDDGAGFGDLQFSFNLAGAVTDGTVLSLMIPDPADLDGDGRIGINDFLLLLATWGWCKDCGTCLGDLDGDCTVGIMDMLELLSRWG
jgi:hypothetical protein